MKRICFNCGRKKEEYFMTWIPKEHLSEIGLQKAKRSKSQHECDDCYSK